MVSGGGSGSRRNATAASLGVLALQGDFAEHLRVLEAIGASGSEVRSCEDLESVDALIIPGGESTAMLKLIDRNELREPLTKRISSGMAVFGTCAGAILLADEVSDGLPPLGGLAVTMVRNAYGRQIRSFEADIPVEALGIEVRGIFIRAPVIQSVGPGVQVMATWAQRPVLVRAGSLLAATFHPELAAETRVHRYFVEQMAGKAA